MDSSESSSYSEEVEDFYDDVYPDPPSSPSKTRKRKARTCLCWNLGNREDKPVLPSIHKPTRGRSLAQKICSPFLFMLCICLSFVKRERGNSASDMKSRWKFPFLRTLVNGVIVFGVAIVLYELFGTSVVLRLVPAILTWALFLYNIYSFFLSGLPTLKKYLGSTYGTVLFFDLFMAQTMSYAAVGFSLWMLDSTPGKAAHFQLIGNESTSGYLAFLRMWVSTVSTVFGPGHIPNLPVSALALVWNFGSLINSVFFVLVVGAWCAPLLDGLIPERRTKRRRISGFDNEKRTAPSTPRRTEMEIPDDDYDQRRRKNERRRKRLPNPTPAQPPPSSSSSSRRTEGIVEMRGSTRCKKH